MENGAEGIHTFILFWSIYLPRLTPKGLHIKSRGSTGGSALERAASERTDIAPRHLFGLRSWRLSPKPANTIFKSGH